MKRKLALLIATCSIVVSILTPASEPNLGTDAPNPAIMRTADHGFGT